MANMLANIFGSSPVRPLEKHIGITFRCAKQLHAFFAAAIKGNWEKAATVRGEIERLEHEADDLKKKIRLGLPKSLFMPVPREDLLELLLVQDKIANRTKDVSGIVVGRKLKIPADAHVDTLVIKGSFPPLMIAPVNFEALYQQALAKQAEGQPAN